MHIQTTEKDLGRLPRETEAGIYLKQFDFNQEVFQKNIRQFLQREQGKKEQESLLRKQRRSQLKAPPLETNWQARATPAFKYFQKFHFPKAESAMAVYESAGDAPLKNFAVSREFKEAVGESLSKGHFEIEHGAAYSGKEGDDLDPYHSRSSRTWQEYAGHAS